MKGTEGRVGLPPSSVPSGTGGGDRRDGVGVDQLGVAVDVHHPGDQAGSAVMDGLLDRRSAPNGKERSPDMVASLRRRPAFGGGTMVRRTSSRSARQARLNLRTGSGPRLSDNAALSTASAASTASSTG
jgi:hypothetical protein